MTKDLKEEELESVTAGFDLDKLTEEERHRYAQLKNAFFDIIQGKTQATVEEYAAAHEAVKAFTEELNTKYPDDRDTK